jgi:hypothetical protein
VGRAAYGTTATISIYNINEQKQNKPNKHTRINKEMKYESIKKHRKLKKKKSTTKVGIQTDFGNWRRDDALRYEANKELSAATLAPTFKYR